MATTSTTANQKKGGGEMSYEQCKHGGVKAWCPVCKAMTTYLKKMREPYDNNKRRIRKENRRKS